MHLRSRIQKAVNGISTINDNLTLKKKLFLLYIICVILPVIIMDGALFLNLLSKETRRQENEMTNIAQSVKYNISQVMDNAVFITKDYWLNDKMNDFLDAQYASPYYFYKSYDDLQNNSIIDISLVGRGASLKLYADNNSIVNGGKFGNFSSIRNSDWYHYFKSSGHTLVIYPYVIKNSSDDFLNEYARCVSVIRSMDHYSGCEKIMKLNIDYSLIENTILNSDFAYPVYVCSGNTILYSNQGNTSPWAEFETFKTSDKKRIGCTLPMDFYTQNWNIYILRQDSNVLLTLHNNLFFILVMLAFSVLFPLFFMYFFNRSFTLRLSELSRHLDGVGKDGERLEKICDVRGKDEIGDLMRDYNHMAARINELIQVVYKGKLEEQEADIARQNAEVLALQSQINPHFLFNALESIRMHSILRHEEETAEMICKLSLMMRQSVEWNRDVVTVAEEIRFVEAYLQLQKYRFGEQLSYRITVSHNCDTLRIPKLTIVTFVENACVHGIEGKASPGWIFIEVTQKEDEVLLEIEDTGIGMSDDRLSAMRESMTCASMERLKSGSGRIGVVNACVRLKTFCQGHVRFEVESEEGVGSTVTIHIPLNCVQNQTDAPRIPANGQSNKKEGRDEPC